MKTKRSSRPDMHSALSPLIELLESNPDSELDHALKRLKKQGYLQDLILALVKDRNRDTDSEDLLGADWNRKWTRTKHKLCQLAQRLDHDASLADQLRPALSTLPGAIDHIKLLSRLRKTAQYLRKSSSKVLTPMDYAAAQLYDCPPTGAAPKRRPGSRLSLKSFLRSTKPKRAYGGFYKDIATVYKAACAGETFDLETIRRLRTRS